MKMPKRVNRRNLICGIFQVINEEDSRKSKTREKEENNQGKVKAENENEENGRQKKKIRIECWKKEMEFSKRDNVSGRIKRRRKEGRERTHPKPKLPKGIKNKKMVKKGRNKRRNGERRRRKSTSYHLKRMIWGHSLSIAALEIYSNVMLPTLSMYKRRRLGELQPAKHHPEIGRFYSKYPKGIVKNVKVKVGNMNFLVDFMVLDTTEDVKLPVISGRPFLATINAIINDAKGEMEISNDHSKKKVIYAAKILHKAPTPPILDFVLEYVRRKKREYEEELSKEEEEEAERPRKKMEEDLRLPWREGDKCQEEKDEFTLPPPPPTP